MAYEKIGFINGQVLNAEDLNHIEEGLENCITQEQLQQYIEEQLLKGEW